MFLSLALFQLEKLIIRIERTNMAFKHMYLFIIML